MWGATDAPALASEPISGEGAAGSVEIRSNRGLLVTREGARGFGRQSSRVSKPRDHDLVTARMWLIGLETAHKLSIPRQQCNSLVRCSRGRLLCGKEVWMTG